MNRVWKLYGDLSLCPLGFDIVQESWQRSEYRWSHSSQKIGHTSIAMFEDWWHPRDAVGAPQYCVISPEIRFVNFYLCNSCGV